MPTCALVVLVMLGADCVLVKLFGPTQLNDVPGSLVALRFKVFPLQIGLLDVAIGVVGLLGSVNIKGPTILDTQPFKVTLTVL